MAEMNSQSHDEKKNVFEIKTEWETETKKTIKICYEIANTMKSDTDNVHAIQIVGTSGSVSGNFLSLAASLGTIVTGISFPPVMFLGGMMTALSAGTKLSTAWGGWADEKSNQRKFDKVLKEHEESSKRMTNILSEIQEKYKKTNRKLCEWLKQATSKNTSNFVIKDIKTQEHALPVGMESMARFEMSKTMATLAAQCSYMGKTAPKPETTFTQTLTMSETKIIVGKTTKITADVGKTTQTVAEATEVSTTIKSSSVKLRSSGSSGTRSFFEYAVPMMNFINLLTDLNELKQLLNGPDQGKAKEICKVAKKLQTRLDEVNVFFDCYIKIGLALQGLENKIKKTKECPPNSTRNLDSLTQIVDEFLVDYFKYEGRDEQKNDPALTCELLETINTVKQHLKQNHPCGIFEIA